MKRTDGQLQGGKAVEKGPISHGSVAGKAMGEEGVESGESYVKCIKSKDELRFQERINAEE